jgi:hypothetical protein
MPVMLRTISPAMLSEPVSQFFKPGSSTTSISESVAQEVTRSELQLYSFHRADQLLLVLNVPISVAHSAVQNWLHGLSNGVQPTLLKDTANCSHENKIMTDSIWHTFNCSYVSHNLIPQYALFSVLL